MVSKKDEDKFKDLPDYQRNQIPSEGNDGPVLADVQDSEWRDYMDKREEHAKKQVKEVAEKRDEQPMSVEEKQQQDLKILQEEREKEAKEAAKQAEEANAKADAETKKTEEAEQKKTARAAGTPTGTNKQKDSDNGGTDPGAGTK